MEIKILSTKKKERKHISFFSYMKFLKTSSLAIRSTQFPEIVEQFLRNLTQLTNRKEFTSLLRGQRSNGTRDVTWRAYDFVKRKKEKKFDQVTYAHSAKQISTVFQFLSCIVFSSIGGDEKVSKIVEEIMS